MIAIVKGEVKPDDIGFSRQAQTDNAAFRRWFGKSKVTDASGKPKIMYHGTGMDFSSFKPGEADAIFLTDNPTFANEFSLRGMGSDLSGFEDGLLQTSCRSM